MNRNKKLIKNVLILLVYFVLSRYLGGYYISKEKCERDILRSLYATDDMFIMEMPDDYLYLSESSSDYTKKVYFDPVDKIVSFVGIEKRGFLYRSLDSDIWDMIKYNDNDIVSYCESWSEGDLVLIYRNNPDVYTVEFDYDDGSLVWWQWKENFIVVFLEEDGQYKRTCKAYDEQGNLITEIKY